MRVDGENERRRWPEDALDELAAAARRRATRRQPATVAEAEVEALSLGRAVAAALLEKSLTAEIDGLASGLVRLGSLQHLGSEIAGRRCPLPASEVAERHDGGFDEAWASTGIDYRIELDSLADQTALTDLLTQVDRVAEIPRALRAGAEVRRR